MIRFVVLAAVLALSACGERPAPQSAANDACTREATHQVTWSNAAAADVISARAEGPSCTQAVVLLTLRNARGDALWTIANTFYDMTAGGVPPEDAPATAPQDVDRFLAAWVDATQLRSSQLPEWREGMSRPGEGVEALGYHSWFERDVYEAMRARDLPLLCFAVAAEGVQCLMMDPASHAPSVLVAYGP